MRSSVLLPLFQGALVGGVYHVVVIAVIFVSSRAHVDFWEGILVIIPSIPRLDGSSHMLIHFS